MKINPLWAYWTDRDIYPVTYELTKIPCDQLHIKYFGYPYPHRIAENFFKAHKEYTHLILHPNDLICTVQNYNKLISTMKEFQYPILSGVCNVDLDKYWDYWNITSNLPDLNYDLRRYNWISKSRYPNMIIEVPFAGFPMMMISREVLEHTNINWLSPQMKGQNKAIWEESGGYSNDLAFAHNLNRLVIPIRCDTSNQILHLRYHGSSMLGKKRPEVKLIKYIEPTISYEPEDQIRSSR